MKKSISGFTVVELLVVITVIAILAAISIVTYTGIQQRARDAQRYTDVATIAKGLQMYQLDNGNFIEVGSGCGGRGNGSGYFNANDGTYPRAVGDCLKEYTGNTEIIDPSGKRSCSGLGCTTYMKYTCSLGTYVYAHLESKPQSSTDLDGTCMPGHDTAYGMNYYVKVD